MANFCHECAQRVAPTMRVCPNCGTTLVDIAPRPTTATVPPPRQEPGGYTPNYSGLHSAPQVPRAPRVPPAAPVPPQAPVPPAADAPQASHAGDIPPFRPVGAATPPSTSPYARAEVGPRLLAAFIDFVIGVAALLPGGALAIAGYAAGEDEGMMVMGWITFVVGFGWALWYALTKDGINGGRSIGKRRVGLMVVHLPSNAPCTRAQSAIRALVAVICNVVPAVGWLIEPVMVLIGEDGRRLGDRAADTQVIAAADYPAERPAAA